MNTNSPYRYGSFKITSPYGPRPALGDYHNGIDLVGVDGDRDIVAIKGGTVAMSRMVSKGVNRTWEWGNYVAILQDDGVMAYYCHLDSRAVKQNHRVEAGELIGVQGNTGYSFGEHLHLELRKDNKAFDPTPYLGIPNESGTIIKVPILQEVDYEDYVMKRCGLEEQTRDYINAYKYSKDLWRKLYEQMV